MKSLPAAMTIGELATRSQLTVDTLRYYEKQGLLQPTERTAAGYRLYDADCLNQIGFIQQAKTVGFTLKEIKELMALSVQEDSTCDEVHRLARERLNQIQAKIQQLRSMEQGLELLMQGCPKGGHSLNYCTIMSGLSDSV